MALNLLRRSGPPLIVEVDVTMSPYDVRARDDRIVCDLSSGDITLRFSATAKRGLEHEVKTRGPASGNEAVLEFPGSSADGESQIVLGEDEAIILTKRIIAWAAS